MSLRHFAAPRLRHSLLVTSLLLQAALAPTPRKRCCARPSEKGPTKWPTASRRMRCGVATSQSRSLDKGGVVYRLDPTTLDVTQIIHNDLKPFGATINHATGTLWLAIPSTALSPLLTPKPAP
ncbi:putative receptor [Klebsiella pneumoniae]|uniref:Putative receptor n=1 Tax=Klebsiella pneumoniae TaxID=573 RepID=A0A2X3F120_KLEPN|nr:putative receptor [Klebsiella pneumoniae]